jgi:hypothetical protein
MKGRSWRTDCFLVLAACHKLCLGDRVCSLHEISKSLSVGEGQGRTKVLPNFLCIWNSSKATTLHPLPSPNCNLDKTSLRMARPSTNLTLFQVACCHIEIEPKLFATEHI